MGMHGNADLVVKYVGSPHLTLQKLPERVHTEGSGQLWRAPVCRVYAVVHRAHNSLSDRWSLVAFHEGTGLGG